MTRPGVFLVALVALVAAWGCGEGTHAPPSGFLLPDAGFTVDTSDAAASDGGGSAGCKDGSPGCPCGKKGAYAFCGWINIRSGPYVACFPGESVCLETLLWGPCEPSAESHVVYPPHR